MLRQIKPRNARSKRALEKREPKAVENPKTCLFLRGNHCSQVVQDAMNDLFSLRQPTSKKFSKKNAIHPFEDPSSIEFFSDKNDASLFVFGSSLKKRPHSLTLMRTFGHKLLDMLELHLDPATYRSIAQFKGAAKPAVGLRPMLLFAGAAFESPLVNEYTLVKSLLLDFFRGEPSDKIDVEGLRYVISVTAADDEASGQMSASEGQGINRGGLIHLRVYTIQTKRSGHKLPRVEVEEMGPRMDLRFGRVKQADETMLKEAMKKARDTEERTKKNISTDAMGDKLGRVHLGKQDLSQMQTRKMKGLKRSRDDSAEPDNVDKEEQKRAKV